MQQHSLTSGPNYDGSRRQVFSMGWPIWVSMISVTIKGVVDMMMVGTLGTDELAGVGFAGIVVFNILCFGVGVLRGQKSLVSQYLGAKEPTEAFRYGVHAFYLSIIFGVACLGLAVLQDNFFVVFASPELSSRTIEAGSAYFNTRLAWGGSMFLILAIGEYLRATGRTQLPMFADLISQPINIFLNYALIFGHFGCPELGVMGAAIGTGIADLLAALIMLVIIRKPLSIQQITLSWHHLKRAFEVGTASGVQFTLEIGSFTMITYFIGHLGTNDLAAHSATINIMHFSFMSAIALADGGSVLIGNYVGANRWKIVHRTLRSMIEITLPLMLGIGSIFFFFGEELIGLYIDDPIPIGIGTKLLVVASAWQVGDALQICIRFALRAAGDHNWVMWAGILTSWGLSVPAAAIAIWALDGNVVTVWWVWNFQVYICTVIFWKRWKNGIWKEKRLVTERAPR
jgi:multidrug resistance protein, MATE family